VRNGEILVSGEVCFLKGRNLYLQNKVWLKLVLPHWTRFVFDSACYYVVIFFLLLVEKGLLLDALLAQSHLHHQHAFINFILLGLFKYNN
jgi:hypothetical protein